MSISRITRLCSLVITVLIIYNAKSQQPFDLDTTFRANFDAWYVNSIKPMADGKILLSGQVRYPGDVVGSFRSSVKLHPNGDFDTSFPNFPYTAGGGSIKPWNDEFMYVQSGPGVRRLTVDGYVDPTYQMTGDGLYYSIFQGGDYHVYPDGRILLSGMHQLFDTIRGFTGLHCLLWFTTDGHLDTTKHHRKCSGSLDDFIQLPDGKFIGDIGSPPNTASWDGQSTASNVFRFHEDGALDTTFQANVWWGGADGFLPLDDGRVYAAGLFRVAGLSDTLHLVRFMPDGSLDPTFNNTIKFRITDMTTHPMGALPRKIHKLDEGRLLVTGSFEEVEGQVRKCIAVIDTNGVLLDDYFADAGVGNFTYQGGTGSVTSGILPTSDGNWYIWGAYHGYDDGTTNDMSQRFISRLHGLSVGEREYSVAERPFLKIYPNPSEAQVFFEIDNLLREGVVELQICDLQGGLIHRREWLSAEEGQGVWDTQGIAKGTYTVSIFQDGRPIQSATLIIQ